MTADLLTFNPSSAQERLWFLSQLFPGDVGYSMATARRIRGELDVRALEKGLKAIVERHDVLRTTFRAAEGKPVQVVAPAGEVRVPLIDLSPLSAEAREGEMGSRASAEVRRPFDLRSGPLFRAVLYRLGRDEHVLLLVMHHIVSDGWSMGILMRELGALYGDFVNGHQPSLLELPIQYADYAERQREWLQGDLLKRELGYWRSQLAGAPQVLDLPTDRPRPAVESHRGAECSFSIPRELSEGLGVLARREGTTLFMVLLAAFDVLLWRYTGQADLLVGTPVANRSRTELEGLIGLFVNTLVLRSDVSGDPTVGELLARVREKCLDAYAHQDLPFEKLVEDLRPERDLSRNPLFQVMLVLQNASVRPLELPGLTVTAVGVERGASQFDLTLYVRETAEGLRGTFQYATDLFEAETVARMGGHLGSVLEGFVAGAKRRISELPLLTKAELLAQQEWNATGAEVSPACVHELISRQAERRPEQVALVFEGRALSYGELERRSERLSQRLRAHGVGPGVRVGVFMERSPEMLVGVLGVLKAGGAYVPLDPAFPAERLSYMLEDSGAAVLLTHAVVAEELPSRVVPVVRVDDEDQELPSSVEREGARARPEDLAYLIYTSGSTGRPKGVLVTHGSLVNLLESMGREPGLSEKDVLLSVTTLSFDIAALELYLPLLKGGKIVLLGREEALDGRRLRERLSASGTTVMQATPATWRLLLESGWEGTPGLKVLCGGEALSRDLADELLRRAGEVWNLYGPTETTVWSSAWRVASGEGAISIGRPIANTQLWVLDGRLELLPVGVPGELYIGGEGVARGYWERPDLTAERFVPDPFSEKAGARLYRTGDLARWLSDGRLECLGRIDQQVKVRGFRIELGEIEAALREFPGVEDAAVLAQDVAGGDRRLAAFLTGGAAAANVTQLRTHLKTRLPAYMVPSSFVFLERLPLTPNGKLDRKTLALDAGAETRRTEHLAPRTAAESLIADLWKDALGVPSVSVRDNFFDLGGHSLLAMRVLAAIEKRTGRRLLPRDIIFQTLEQLAATLPAISAGEGPWAPPPRSLAGRVLEAVKGMVSGRRPAR